MISKIGVKIEYLLFGVGIVFQLTGISLITLADADATGLFYTGVAIFMISLILIFLWFLLATSRSMRESTDSSIVNPN